MDTFLIKKDETVKQAMRQMKQVGEKQLFVVDETGKLFGAISDGDIRKWILSEGSLEEKLIKVCNKKPITVGKDYNLNDVKKIMLDLKIEAIPVIIANQEIIDILVWDQIFRGDVKRQKEKLEIPVVIMAGGRGSRLDPFTRILPKPLIPIGDKPILEIIIEKFREYGINDFYLSINHKSKMIKSYFEEMNERYNIKYIEEDMPLGTAGSLKLLPHQISGPFLVTNCDIIIDSDYSEIIKFHRESGYDMTIVVSYKHYVIPYGVCEIVNGGILREIKEKPEHDLLVNTGMYVINPKLIDLIPDRRFFNITDLIREVKDNGYKVGVFPISERSWIDIGQWEEYHKALKNMKVE
jgi:dTDP-glucose pyrophosphorylase